MDAISSCLMGGSSPEYVRQLEMQLALELGRKHAVAVSSGTAALHMALLSLSISAGDEVICPSYTCTAICNAIMYTGATPILADCRYDVESMDYHIDFEDVRGKLTERTKAIIVPHMFGTVVDMNPFFETGIPVIEDGTLSLGATRNGVQSGQSGTIAVFSFHETKMISAISGGVILTDDPELYHNMLSRLESTDHHKAFSVRYNYEMPAVHAALASNQLRKLNKFIQMRRATAALYNERLSPYRDRVTLPNLSSENVFFRYMMELPASIAPATMLNYCASEHIQLGRGVYPPLHQYLNEGDATAYPNTNRAVNSLVSIPIHPSVTESEAEYIMDKVIQVIRS